MEKKQNDIYQYHKDVWKTAKSDTVLYFRSDWKGIFGGVISGIVGALISVWLSNIGLNQSITQWGIDIIIIIASGLLGTTIWMLLLYLVNGLWFTPQKMKVNSDKLHKEELEKLNSLYQAEKNKVNKRTWENISVNGKDIISGNEFVGYEIELKNGKTQNYTFRMEFKYLELDGKKFGEKIFPVWRYGGLDKQGVIKGGISLESNAIGEWWLFRIKGGGENRKSVIVYSVSEERNAENIPEEKHASFSDFAIGELEIFGAHISFGLDRQRNGPTIESIYGSSIYNFRIDIIQGKATLKFNEGHLKIYN